MQVLFSLFFFLWEDPRLCYRARTKPGAMDIPGKGATGFMQVNQALTGRSSSVDVLLIAMVCEVFVSAVLKFYDVRPVQKNPRHKTGGRVYR